MKTENTNKIDHSQLWLYDVTFNIYKLKDMNCLRQLKHISQAPSNQKRNL